MLRYSLLIAFAATVATADTHYVDINNLSPSSPYTNWATAATDIKTAIMASVSGDTILVADGTYDTNGNPDGIDVDEGVTVISQNGPASAIIDPEGFGIGFRLEHPDAKVVGFTIQNGYSGEGAGVWSWHDSCIVSNCIIQGCVSDGIGGGMANGTAINCQFLGNVAEIGGGMVQGTAKNCLFRYNHAENDGGGMLDSTAYNCTIVENSCDQYDGGGIKGTTAYNSIIYDNINLNGNVPDNVADSTCYYSCAPDLIPGTDGNITDPPQFISPMTGNFRLLETSATVDAGLNAYAISLPTDLDGTPRILDTRVDMGAYEFRPLEFEDTLYLRVRLQESTDLSSWHDSSYFMEWTAPTSESNMFYRARLEVLN